LSSLMGSEWSTIGFALEDLYEMAAIAEQGGFDFYARLIARATQPRVKNELKFLRDEEAAHKAFFLEQLRARGGAPRGTVTQELQAVLAREFLEPLERVYSSGDISDGDKALSFGCMLEEKSIGFSPRSGPPWDQESSPALTASSRRKKGTGRPLSFSGHEVPGSSPALSLSILAGSSRIWMFFSCVGSTVPFFAPLARRRYFTWV
jgi:hypothetical protein